MTAVTVLELASPNKKARAAYSRLEHELARAIDLHVQGRVSLVVEDARVEIPEPILRALLRTVHEQAAGRRIRVIAPDSELELTPNQAAQYLGISRPLLVKLLNEGSIPARTLPGSRHRRIATADLEVYQANKAGRRGRLAAAMNEVATAELCFPRAQ